MATQKKQQQSLFPDFPRESPVLNKNGDFNPLWDLGLGTLFQALQANFKDEGIRIPPLSDANMTIIQNIYVTYIGGTYNDLTRAQPDISGQTVYDTDSSTMNQFVITQDANTPKQVTMAQWVPFAYMLNFAGNPNGNVAGNLYYLCYDSVGMALYICTVAGSSAGQGGTTQAVWTLV